MAEPEPGASMAAGRLEALGDGVFAIAMTLLILNIQVPERATSETLWPRLVALWPKFASYVLSFVMLGVLWIGHYFQFQYIKRTDRPLIWLNLLFLMTITFLPFSTGLLGSYYDSHAAVAIYGATVEVSGVALLAHWAHATGKRHLVPVDVPPLVVATLRARIVFGIVVSTVGVAVGFASTRASLILFLLLPIGYVLPSRIDRKQPPKSGVGAG